MLRSRASRREESLEVHLPEPIISRADGIDPEQTALLADAVGLALLVVLDTLAPAERLAFVLHDTFAVPFEEIAAILGRSPAATRQLAMQTINDDDASLGASERRLRDQRWLMLIGSSGLDRESTRVAHARRALAAARIVAADQVLHGRFWRSLYAGLADLRDLNAQALAGDLTSARSTLGRMKTDIDTADGLSTSPGLPADLHDMTTVLTNFVQDYGKQLDAEVAGDDAAAAAQRANVSADVASLDKYDVDRIGAEIAAFFKPMIDTFNSEIAAATA